MLAGLLGPMTPFDFFYRQKIMDAYCSQRKLEMSYFLLLKAHPYQ